MRDFRDKRYVIGVLLVDEISPPLQTVSIAMPFQFYL